MITVATVEWGDYCGRGDDYVARLQGAVARHLRAAHRFVALRLDASPLEGWFRKLELFRPGRFDGRVLYLDLDTVVVGDLAPLCVPGALHLRDWGWADDVVFCGALCWDGGAWSERLWRTFEAVGEDGFTDDQRWMTRHARWARWPAGPLASYRYHARDGVPAGACAVAFHGRPKPHEVADAWVRAAWRA